MANVVVEFSVSLLDYMGVRGSTNFVADMADTTTIAALVTKAQTLETTIDAVTGAAILGSAVRILPVTVGGIKTTGIAGADLEKTLLINFAQSGMSHKYGVDIPGVDPAVLTAGRPDPTSAAIIALVALLEGNYTSAALNALTAVRDYAVTFRKRRSELNRVATVA